MAIVHVFTHADKVETFSAGQTIFQEGDQASVMYVVQEGEVDVYFRGQHLETIGAGGILGEMALIEPSSRSATAVARTQCKLAPIDEMGFKVYIHHTPTFAVQVMRIMADRLRRMNERMLTGPAGAA